MRSRLPPGSPPSPPIERTQPPLAMGQSNSIRVLVADDSALMRRTLRRALECDPDIKVIDTARDGEDAVIKARELRPDVITMDINMPRMDGLTAVQLIVAEGICPVLMVSSLTQRGAVATFEALELGAFDYIAKPGGTVSADLSSVSAEIRSKIKAAAAGGAIRRIQSGLKRRTQIAPGPTAVPSPPRPPGSTAGPFPYRAVALGISTGGPSTLMEVLPRIPAEAGAAFFLVQHMPPTFLTSFAQRLAKSCQIRVHEAEAGMPVKPGCCYLGRGGLHLTVFRKLNGEIVLRTPSRPETLFMPSVDVMMESVHAIYGPATVGVLMTGIGDDGARMMVKLRQEGCPTIAESEETAVVYGMPREAVERGGAGVVAPSYNIADEILKAIRA